MDTIRRYLYYSKEGMVEQCRVSLMEMLLKDGINYKETVTWAVIKT